jgi:hypothetical protein
MKRSTRFFTAVAITLLAAVVAVGVWAGPSGRSGTVPTPPPDGIGCSGTANNFGTGTIKATGSSDCTVSVRHGGAFGTLPLGWSLLADVLEVKAVSGTVSQLEVCMPFSPSWKGKVAGESINFFYFNSAKSAWIAVPTVIKGNGVPPVVCGTSTSAGFYALLGK